MISIKINVGKIAKDKMYYGKKGTYLDAVLIETPKSQYGDDYVIIQSLSEADRKAGQKGAILGNARIVAAKTEEEEDHKPAQPPKEKLPF